MPRVLILGANGSIAREATKLFLDETDAELKKESRRCRSAHSDRALRSRPSDSAAWA
jgi:dihydrodipicolinate reductase